jgi:hypothetical protein
VADEKESERKRGPKGGMKHTPGRGHSRRSASKKKKRFQKRAASKRREEQAEARMQWERWESLPREAQRLLRDLKPLLPRPTNEE